MAQTDTTLTPFDRQSIELHVGQSPQGTLSYGPVTQAGPANPYVANPKGPSDVPYVSAQGAGVASNTTNSAMANAAASVVNSTIVGVKFALPA